METYRHKIGETITLSLLISNPATPSNPIVNDAIVYLSIQRQSDNCWLNFISNKFDKNGPGDNYRTSCNNVNNLYKYVFNHSNYDAHKPNSYLMYFTAIIDGEEFTTVEEHNFSR